MTQETISIPEEIIAFLDAHREGQATLEMGEAAERALPSMPNIGSAIEMITGAVASAMDDLRNGREKTFDMFEVTFFARTTDKAAAIAAGDAISEKLGRVELYADEESGEFELQIPAHLPGNVRVFDEVEAELDAVLADFGMECDGREARPLDDEEQPSGIIAAIGSFLATLTNRVTQALARRQQRRKPE